MDSLNPQSVFASVTATEVSGATLEVRTMEHCSMGSPPISVINRYEMSTSDVGI